MCACVCTQVCLYVSMYAFMNMKKKEPAAGSYKSMLLSGIVLNQRGLHYGHESSFKDYNPKIVSKLSY